MSDRLFTAFIIAIYAFVLIWIGSKHIYNRLKRSKNNCSNTPQTQSTNMEESHEGTHKKTLKDVKHVEVSSEGADEYEHTIAGPFNEIFHMFMSIGPEMVQTILKVEKSMIILQGEFDKEEFSKERVNELMGFMLSALNQLEAASIQLIDRMVNVYIENKPNGQSEEVKIDQELMKGYITIVNSLEDITTNYTYRLQKLVKSFKTKYPEKLSEYTTISEKLVYVLFIVISCCSNRLDKQITVYTT